jgi:hypothetical protein
VLESFVQTIGSAIALGVIQAVGPEAAFIFNAFTFLVSALLVLLPVPLGHPVITRGWSGFVADAREGLHYARLNRFVSRLVLVQGMAALSVGATSALLVVLAQRHYQLPLVALAPSFLPSVSEPSSGHSCWACS